MQAYVASKCRLSVLSGSSSKNALRSLRGNPRSVGIAKHGAGSRSEQTRALSEAWRGQYTTNKWQVARRYYSTETEEVAGDEEEVPNYTDDDLMFGTVEANGFRILGDSETDVDVPHWENMVRTAFNQMRFSDAVAAYENIRGIGSNAAEMSDLHIRALDYIGFRDEDILKSYKDMRDKGVKILAESYAKVMKVLMKKGEKKLILDLYQVMLSEGTRGTPEVYAVLLTLYYKSDPKDIDTVQGILATMKAHKIQPDLNVVDRLLIAFCEVDRHDLIQSTYDEFVVKGGIRPGRIINSIMAESYLLRDKFGSANGFLRALHVAHQYPRLRTYELLIDYYLRKNKLPQASQTMAELQLGAKRKASRTIYKSFFKYYERTNDYMGHQDTLAKMVTEEVAPDAEILETMLMLYYNHGKQAEFMGTFVLMLDRQMMPSRHLWTRRLQLLSEDEKLDFVLLLKEYEYMLQAGMTPTEEELRIILQAMHTAQRPDLAERFARDDMSRHKVRLDANDYAMIVRNYTKVGARDLAKEAYYKFVTAGLVDAEPHVVMIQAYLSWGEAENAIELFSSLRKWVLEEKKMALHDPQGPVLIEALASLGEDGHTLVQQAFELATEHANIKGHMSTDIFVLMIEYLSKHYYIESALSYYRAMQEKWKFAPTIRIYQALLEGIARQTELTQSNALLPTAFDVFRNAVLDAALSPLPTKLVSTYMLYLVRHGSSEGLSHGVNWYKNIGSAHEQVLDSVTTVALKKWVRALQDPSALFPAKYTSRNLDLIRDTLPTDKELDTRTYEL